MKKGLDLYNKFVLTHRGFSDDQWTLAYFGGSPGEGSDISWCPDCVSMAGELAAFLSKYDGPVRVVQFMVGSRGEWENGSPFKEQFPFLVDLPTAVLFYGRLDVARIIIPQESDLSYLCERAKAYSEQIRTGAWHPPKRG